MRYLIGVDEAGYGPNLGPLVIAASVWELSDHDEAAPASLADGRSNCRLFPRLESCVRQQASRSTQPDPRLWLADSKTIYRGGSGLDQLERGVLSCLRSLGHAPRGWRELCEVLAPQALRRADLPKWYDSFAMALPQAAAEQEVASGAECLAQGCATGGARLRDVVCRVIFPDEFNQLVERRGSKGVLLSEASLDLIAQVLARLPRSAEASEAAEPPPFRLSGDSVSRRNRAPASQSNWPDSGQSGVAVVARRTRSGRTAAFAEAVAELPPTKIEIFCDKHGGRNKYAGLLQHVFPDAFPEIECEQAQASAYRCELPQAAARFRFEVGGERHLPVALASMTAKYVRELVMRAFNAFWQSHRPEVRPTAGYPADAKRFLAEIADLQTALGISSRQLWRER